MNGPVLHMCECSTRSNLFLSLSACSIANIRRWVLLNCLVLCMCMWIFDQKYNLFLSCLLVSLPTLAGEFYWMILCCGCVCLTRSNLFLFLSAYSNANISKWVYWMVLCVCVYFWPVCVSLLVCSLRIHCQQSGGKFMVSFLCLTRSNPFLSLSALSIANISEWVLLNGLVLCMCVFDQK